MLSGLQEQIRISCPQTEATEWSVPASVLLMIVLGIFVWLIWPLMGMPVVLS